MLSATAIARTDYVLHDGCYKLQTEWFDALVSVCNKFRADDAFRRSVCPYQVLEKSYSDWASYRDIVIAARTRNA